MRLAPALFLSLLLAVPALAQDAPVVQQWRQPPAATTMRSLIDEGFEIKTAYQSSSPIGSGHVETTTTLLQRGAEVYRCREVAAFSAEGDLQSQLLQCTVLSVPYDAKATAAG